METIRHIQNVVHSTRQLPWTLPKSVSFLKSGGTVLYLKRIQKYKNQMSYVNLGEQGFGGGEGIKRHSREN